MRGCNWRRLGWIEDPKPSVQRESKRSWKGLADIIIEADPQQPCPELISDKAAPHPIPSRVRQAPDNTSPSFNTQQVDAFVTKFLLGATASCFFYSSCVSSLFLLRIRPAQHPHKQYPPRPCLAAPRHDHRLAMATTPQAASKSPTIRRIRTSSISLPLPLSLLSRDTPY